MNNHGKILNLVFCYMFDLKNMHVSIKGVLRQYSIIHVTYFYKYVNLHDYSLEKPMKLRYICLACLCT